MIKIAHIVHELKIGGVENSIQYHLKNTAHRYKVFCLGGVDHEFVAGIDLEMICFRKAEEGRFEYFFRLIREVKEFSPGILISSLWRSHLFAVVIFFLCKKIQWIPFFHSAQYFHLFDLVSTRIAVFISKICFSDSKATTKYLKEFNNSIEVKEVSFLFPLQRIQCEKLYDRVCYFGRLTKVKNVDYAIEIISAVNKFENLYFDIYGDGEEFHRLRHKIKLLNLDDRVIFKGKVMPEKVPHIMAKYRYYLQTSLYEGMSISVSQAMRVGCCCFVTFVGGIKDYAINGENAIELPLNDVDASARIMLSIISDKQKSLEISRSAPECFKSKRSYSESLDDLCTDVFIGL